MPTHCSLASPWPCSRSLENLVADHCHGKRSLHAAMQARELIMYVYTIRGALGEHAMQQAARPSQASPQTMLRISRLGFVEKTRRMSLIDVLKDSALKADCIFIGAPQWLSRGALPHDPFYPVLSPVPHYSYRCMVRSRLLLN